MKRGSQMKVKCLIQLTLNLEASRADGIPERLEGSEGVGKQKAEEASVL